MVPFTEHDPLFEIALQCTSGVGAMTDFLSEPMDENVFCEPDTSAKQDKRKAEERRLDAGYRLGEWDVVSTACRVARLQEEYNLGSLIWISFPVSITVSCVAEGSMCRTTRATAGCACW